MAQTELANTIMYYFLGGLLAVIPLLAWGWIFYKKRPENRKQTVISFFAGIFSVIPLFVVLGDLGNISISIGGLQIQGLHIYHQIESLARNPGPLSLATYILISTMVFFLIYIISAIITFILAITTGETSLSSYQRTLKKSLEEPFLLLSLGVLIGVLAYFFRWNLHEVFWKSMMIGVVEEYAKHLLVRFVDEEKFTSISDVIEFSILVALGFAFLENILYFVNRIWLSPCSAEEISAYLCLYDEGAGKYIHKVGVLLGPFIFRSLFSTLAHVIFSGIFGYFYGIAHFAPREFIEARKQKRFYPHIEFLHKLLYLKKSVVFHKQKILEGAILAMTFHGFFDFVLDEQVSQMYLAHFSPGPLFLLVPPLMAGYYFIMKALDSPYNQKVCSLSEIRSKSCTFEGE